MKSSFASKVHSSFSTVQLILPVCFALLGSGARAASINGTVTYSGSQTGKVLVRAAQTVPGNKVLNLEGTGNFVQVPDLRDLSGSEITIQYWFKGGSIQSAVRQQSAGYIVAGWNEMHILSHDGGTGGIRVGEGHNDGNWHHIAMTWKQGTRNGFASYMDGKLVQSRDSANSPIPSHNAGLYFGSIGGQGEFMDGKLDEIAVWRKALTPEEIAATWNKRLTGAESDLIGFWNFEDGTANDLSPNLYQGFLEGNAFVEEDGIGGLGGGIASVELAAPGAYTFPDLPEGAGYSVTALLDKNANGRQDPGEPFGAYPGNPFTLTGTKNGVDIELQEGPKILVQPVGGRFGAGATITLKVEAEGNPPLTYSWRKDDTDLTDGGAVTGSKTAELKITNATEANSGIYSVVVGNNVGSTPSNPARIQVVANGATISGQLTYSGSQTGKIHVNLGQRKAANKALALDGSGDSVTTTLSSLAGSEITIQYWFKGSAPQSAVRQQGGAGYIVAGWGNLHIMSNDRGTVGIPMGEVTDGGWHHVVMTWKQGSPGGFSSYMDGQLVARRDSATSPIPDMGAPVYFGSFNGSGEFTKGMLDEIAIWTRALTASEIAAKWSLPLTGQEAGLLGYWDFDSGAVVDKTANGNNGELLGDAAIVDATIPNMGSVYDATIDSGLSFEIPNVPSGAGFAASAFLDANGNNVQDPTEPSGTFSGNPFAISGNKSDVNFTLTEAPRITSQPSPMRATTGTHAMFTAAAAGTAPLSYQWSKDGVDLADSARISGAKGTQLMINGVTDADEGLYRLKVTNAQGETLSREVSLSAVSGGVNLSGEIKYSGSQPGRFIIKAEQFKAGNKALKLDGTGDYAVVPELTNLSGEQITISYWFKGATMQSIVRQQGGGYIVAGYGGQHILSHDGGTGGVQAGANATDGNWHHFVMTWKTESENGFASYMDGKLVEQRASSPTLIPDHNVPVYFGSFNGTGEFATGEIDEIAIWNRALTSAEISQLWDDVLTGSEQGLSGFWNFDSGAVTDLTPNGFDGELGGDAAIVDARIPGLGGGTTIEELLAPGAFTIAHVPAGQNYFISAFLDSDLSGFPNEGEVEITYPSNPVDLSADKSGIILDLGGDPRLSIIKVQNALQIFWDPAITGYVLESTTRLESDIWTPVPGVVNNRTEVFTTPSVRFFRLRKSN